MAHEDDKAESWWRGKLSLLRRSWWKQGVCRMAKPRVLITRMEQYVVQRSNTSAGRLEVGVVACN